MKLVLKTKILLGVLTCLLALNFLSFGQNTELETLKLNTTEKKILLSSVKLGETRLIDNIEFS